jgi:hypothetical protein
MYKRACWLFLALGVLGVPATSRHAFSDDLKPPEKEAIQYSRVMRPDWAVSIALADCKGIAANNPVEPYYTRWIMCNEPIFIDVDGKPRDATRAAISYAANTAMLHGSEAYRPIPNPAGILFRMNLAEYANDDEKKLKLLVDTWERMQDNQFYLRIDKKKEVGSPRYSFGGKTWDRRTIPLLIPAAHADVSGNLAELCKMTQSQVPIISAGQFMRFTLNSDFGGLYPEFRQFDLAPVKGTVEEGLLARAGINLGQLGKNNTDQRVITMRKPTSTPGIVEYFPTAVTQAAVGPIVGSITRDYFAYKEIDPDKHPFENLDERKHDGSEGFIPTAAGNIEYWLTDANGGFVRQAPPNLACDRTIPAPFLPILQAPSSCIRCHIKQNPAQARLGIFQPAPNYVLWMRDVEVQGYRFDLLGEFKNKKDDSIKKLLSLYKGETDEAFAYSGRTYSKFVFDATGMPLEQATDAMFQCHDSWLYSYVTPRKAMLTLGYKVATDAEAVELFNTICPPAIEPLRITQLRAWKADPGTGIMRELPMTIDDWLSVYPETAFRIQKYEDANGLTPPELSTSLH